MVPGPCVIEYAPAQEKSHVIYPGLVSPRAGFPRSPSLLLSDGPASAAATLRTGEWSMSIIIVHILVPWRPGLVRKTAPQVLANEKSSNLNLKSPSCTCPASLNSK